MMPLATDAAVASSSITESVVMRWSLGDRKDGRQISGCTSGMAFRSKLFYDAEEEAILGKWKKWNYSWKNLKEKVK
jgi:hypothetical protein